MARIKNERRGILKRALFAAFPHTIPILAGYLFLGFSFGVLMSASGFPIIYSFIMSVVIFAGSGQLLAVDLLLGAFDPIGAILMTLMINARHLFYGISMHEKFRGTGIKKLYMIFGMTDETFSVNCSVAVPDGVDSGWFMFFVTLLDHIYWICGCCLGAIFGRLVPFNTEGIDFVMTAMFVVIFTDRWLKEKNHTCSIMGLLLPALCLLIFGAENFIIPSMIAILLFLTVFKKPIEGGIA